MYQVSVKLLMLRSVKMLTKHISQKYMTNDFSILFIPIRSQIRVFLGITTTLNIPVMQ